MPGTVEVLLTQAGGNSGQAEAQVVTPVPQEPVASRRAAEYAVGIPAAAPLYPARARRRPRRVDYLFIWIGPVPVRTPLRDVAVHVIQPQGVRLVLATGVVFFSKGPLGALPYG